MWFRVRGRGLWIQFFKTEFEIASIKFFMFAI